MNIGFFHPDMGYWQALEGDAETLLAGYPEGTIEVPIRPAPDYDWQDGEWIYVAPEIDLPAYVASKRWEVETGGIVVAGVPVATDDRSKIMIIGARVKADTDAAFTTQWKTHEGFLTIDAATIIAISDAVLAHVDSCFAVEDAVLAEIDAGAITSIEQVDAADWPS